MKICLKQIIEFFKSNPLRQLYIIRMTSYIVIVAAAIVYYCLNININWFSEFLTKDIVDYFIWLSSWFYWFIMFFLLTCLFVKGLYYIFIEKAIKVGFKINIEEWLANFNIFLHIINFIFRLLYLCFSLFLLLMALENKSTPEFLIYVILAILGLSHEFFWRIRRYYKRMYSGKSK